MSEMFDINIIETERNLILGTQRIIYKTIESINTTLYY